MLLGTLPFTHISGLLFYNTAFAVGATVVLFAKTELNDILSAIQTHKITTMILFPIFAQKLFHSPLIEKYDVSSVAKFIVGGGPTPSVMARGLVDKFGLESYRHGYGLTETFGVALIAPAASREYGSVGVPIAMAKVKVVDVDSRQKLGPRELGEICVKGPFCVSGYIGQPESGSQLYDDGGFIQTGTTRNTGV